MSIVLKRNKKAQLYDRAKVENSIRKSFQVTSTDISDEEMNGIIAQLHITDGISTSEIQTQVENILMKRGYYEQARYFIIWRHINYHDRIMSGKVKFMRSYLSATNAASGSKYDANANVISKNLATLSGELFKGDVIKLNRYRLSAKIKELYGPELAEEYIRQLESHELYKHDESSILPYCTAITMYPFLLSGIRDIGGLSAEPKNIDSFCGMFVNLVFAVACQFAGAVATGEFLMYFDYYARKEWGNNYWKYADKNPAKLKYDDNGDEIEITIEKQIEQYFQQIVYSINQPAAARSYQSVFWNISYFDKYYFDGMFHDFRFPDGTAPLWNSLNWLQKKFMTWFNKERTKTILTFPVETVAMLTDGEDIKDKEWADWTAEMYSKGHSFFTYLSDNPDSLSSCCRLRNEVTDNQFSYSLGAGGIATGSKSVMTLNLNRLIQNAVRDKNNYVEYLRDQVHKIHKYQHAFNELIKEYKELGALQVYDAGYISLEKQYLTIGVNGMVEAAEFLGIKPGPNEEYQGFVNSILQVFYEENKKARTKELMYNTEFVPAENLGVKHFKWDKEAGYVVPKNRNCYNSYFYPVEDTSLTIIDKFKLHGKGFVQYLDGGSALHMNLDSHLTKAQYRQLLRVATKEGTNYFTFNIPNTICNKCGHIDKRYLKACPECGSNDIDYATRVIGYLKRISNFSMERQIEAGQRYYNPNDERNMKELITTSNSNEEFICNESEGCPIVPGEDGW